jgi:predicted CoA-binding protein
MLVKTYGSAVFGIDATTITIEVNASAGIKFFLVGLPDNAVKESHYRIEAALKNTGYLLVPCKNNRQIHKCNAFAKIYSCRSHLDV